MIRKILDWYFKGKCASCYAYRHKQCALMTSKHCGVKTKPTEGCDQWLPIGEIK